MTQQAKPPELEHPTNDRDPDAGPGWWLVLLSSGICVAGAAVALVLTLLF